MRLACLAALALAAVLRAQPADLQATFDAHGLATLTSQGVTLLGPDDERPKIFNLLWRQADGTVRQAFDPKPKSRVFDADQRVLTVDYGWAEARVGYKVVGARLDVEVTLTNRGTEPMAPVEFWPLRLRLPRRARNLDAQAGALGVLLEHEQGVLALLNDTPTTRLSLRSAYTHPKTSAGPLELATSAPRIAKHPVVDNRWFSDPGQPLAPGASAVWRFHLVAGAPGQSLDDLCPERLARFQRDNPVTLRWPDRRPIGTIFYAHPSRGWKTNPRGFNFGRAERHDVFTPEGQEVFARELLAYADRCVANLKAMGAQGMILWDLEGEEMPHMISYVGDPRRLALAAPEMEKLADAFFARFRDAGLRTGICIRPTEFYERTPGQRNFDQRDVADPVAVMNEKIAYAQQRWGCTLYYLDSNVFGNGNGTVLPKDSGVPWLMPTSMVRALHEAHPDCLIVPEWSGFDYYRHSAPYSSQNLRQMGLDPGTRRVFPGAFRVIMVDLGGLEQRWDGYLDNVRGGDVLLFPCWYGAAENEIVALIYREAKLLANPTADDEARRLHAAPAAEAPEKLLDDPSPLVRKAALKALAKRGARDDAALADRLLALLTGAKDPVGRALRPFVADAAGSLGPGAAPKLAALLAGKNAELWGYAIRGLGRTGTTDATVIAALTGALTDPARRGLREQLAGALGGLKATAAVPALLELLGPTNKDEHVRQAVVVALGRIGDPAAIEPLVREFRQPYGTVVVYSIQGCLNEALTRLTGERNRVGGDDWRRWWAARPAADPK